MQNSPTLDHDNRIGSVRQASAPAGACQFFDGQPCGAGSASVPAAGRWQLNVWEVRVMDGVDTNPRHAATPQRIRWFVPGRSPGLEVLVHRLPRSSTQWRVDEPALPYRCGGSAGIDFRSHRLPVSPGTENHARAPRTGRSIAKPARLLASAPCHATLAAGLACKNNYFAHARIADRIDACQGLRKGRRAFFRPSRR